MVDGREFVAVRRRWTGQFMGRRKHHDERDHARRAEYPETARWHAHDERLTRQRMERMAAEAESGRLAAEAARLRRNLVLVTVAVFAVAGLATSAREVEAEIARHLRNKGYCRVSEVR